MKFKFNKPILFVEVSWSHEKIWISFSGWMKRLLYKMKIIKSSSVIDRTKQVTEL